jgi:hypothetical protein
MHEFFFDLNINFYIYIYIYIYILCQLYSSEAQALHSPHKSSPSLCFAPERLNPMAQRRVLLLCGDYMEDYEASSEPGYSLTSFALLSSSVLAFFELVYAINVLQCDF